MIKDTSNRVNDAQFKIPEVRFNLKSHKKGDKEVLIVGMFRIPNKPLLRYSTQRHVDPKYWNKKERRCKESVNYIDGAIINKDLDLIRSTIRAIYTELGPDIDPKSIKAETDIQLGRRERPRQKADDYKSFAEFLDFEINKNKLRVNGLKGGQTWQKYESLKERINQYSIETGFQSQYENFNLTFKDDFVLWLEGKELSQNTISKDIETIKSLLRRSRRYHNNHIYNDPDFKVSRIKTTKHYPTLDELKTLYNFKFENKTYQEVADLYLVSAFGGGLRISDVTRLTQDNERIIDGERFLHVYTYKGRTVKEDNEVVIPFTPQLESIIEKYNWKLPSYSEQYINDTLKELFKEAKLDRQKLIKTGKKSDKAELKALHEVVIFHSARYAYIDYMMNDLDISAEELRKITGQSLKTLLGYERGDKRKNAQKVSSKINSKLRGLHVVGKQSAS